MQSFWQDKIRIGSLLIPRFVSGPLDGITDAPFRKLVREFSRDELLYTEMRHVSAVANDKGSIKALQFDQSERPLSYQVAANYEQSIELACDKIVAKGVDIVDLNIGCPARNVVGSGSGSALMADLPRLEKILNCFRKRLTIPFTIKIRAGFKQTNALDVAKLAVDCGVDAIAIHPRLQTAFFQGRPDYAIAAQLKQNVSVPVFFSGGVVNFKTAQWVYEQTGVDGFLIGRGMWAKPWKLQEIAAHAAGQPYTVNTQEVLTCAIKHFNYMVDYYGDHAVYIFRKHVPFYIHGLENAAQLRQSLVACKQKEELYCQLQRALDIVQSR